MKVNLPFLIQLHDRRRGNRLRDGPDTEDRLVGVGWHLLLKIGISVPLHQLSLTVLHNRHHRTRHMILLHLAIHKIVQKSLKLLLVWSGRAYGSRKYGA
ncbi:hypothetical protein D3C81_1016510 [compost metagenome]